jgi:DsbC/DsbD-like thiol-disulfide interchange protein
MRLRSLFLVPLVMLAAVSMAQEPSPKAELILPATVKAGQTVKAKVKLIIPPGLHAYQNPPTKDYMIPIEISSPDKATKLKVAYPPGALKNFAGDEAAVYEGVVEIPVEFVAPKKIGVFNIKLNVGYQQCDDKQCYPPGELKVTGKVQVKKA